MACTVAAIEFAKKRLASLTVLSGLEAAEVYDRMFERVRHALILVHSYAPRDDAADIASSPGSFDEFAGGLVGTGGHWGHCTAGQWSGYGWCCYGSRSYRYLVL